MPKNESLKSILIIGSGPIVIGQACEFDYSGSQAARSLREEGIEVSLINSNPATIMTDKNLADATYLEPITSDAIENIITPTIATAGSKRKILILINKTNTKFPFMCTRGSKMLVVTLKHSVAICFVN